MTGLARTSSWMLPMTLMELLIASVQLRVVLVVPEAVDC